ncbi:MAG TPA: response regulator transcription factor [Microlunatus sp.]|nr:response regulator transcription factor [Microlunatus sp.]
METAGGPPIAVASCDEARTTVLIADADPLVASGLALIIGGARDLEVVGTYDRGTDAVFQAQCHPPDVIVLDVRLLEIDGYTTLRLLDAGRGRPGPRVVLVSAADDDETVIQAVLAGAAGYVLKRTAHEELVRAVRHVAAGHAWLDQQVVAPVIDALARTPRARQSGARPSCGRLTPRELEVLVLMADGLSNSEISQQLVVSEGTVKTHVSRVLMKLAVRDRGQAIAVAYRSGWVSLAS